MPNYKNGKIYMICGGDDRYYGSTVQSLSRRMVQHRFMSGLGEYIKYRCCSFILFQKYGTDNCTIELVEAYPCDSVEELNRKEGEYIRQNNCINKKIAGRTRIEYYQDNRDKELQQQKERYIKRREILIQKHTCECGGFYTLKNIRKHQKTKKHQKNLSTK